ncbi:MAG TPA: guanylate kinase [bacterium]|nr:guanylate kinase [bacterium]
MVSSHKDRRRLVLVISGPSGAGKSTVSEALFKDAELFSVLERSVSATTRPPRPGEENGVSYHFVTDDEFERMVSVGEFLEWAKVHNACYGTPRSNIARAFDAGRDLLLEIDVQGALNVKKEYPDAVLIFITAPMEVLIDRLKKRPSSLTGDALQAEIDLRMNTAKKELAVMNEYDYCVLNENLDETVKTIISIILAERCRIVKK